MDRSYEIARKALLISLLLSLNYALPAICSTPNLKELTLSQLKDIDTGTLDKKQSKLHKKLIKQKQKRWDRAYKKEKKNFDKSEEKRLSQLTTHPYFLASSLTKIEDSEFSTTPSAQGPSVLVQGEAWTGVFVRVFIRSLDPDNHQIYVEDSYNSKDEQYFFNRASFSGGKPASFTEISWDVSWCNDFGCRRSESYALNITKDELATMFEAGEAVRFQTMSKAGYKRTIEVPHDYLKGYITAINDKMNVIGSEQAKKTSAEMVKLHGPRKFVFEMDI